MTQDETNRAGGQDDVGSHARTLPGVRSVGSILVDLGALGFVIATGFATALVVAPFILQPVF